jgi:hypothetical protein
MEWCLGYVCNGTSELTHLCLGISHVQKLGSFVTNVLIDCHYVCEPHLEDNKGKNTTHE